MLSRVPAALLALLAFGAVATATPALATSAAPTADGPIGQHALAVDGDAAGQQTPAPSPLAVNETTFTVSLDESGDATWTVSTRFAVTTEAERAAFDDVAGRFEDGRTDSSLGLGAFREANDAAEEYTGRSMEVTDVERSADRADGTLTLRFRWTNFANEGENVTTVGDAFRTENGVWLSGLSDRQTLVVELPAGYGFLAVPNEGSYETEAGSIRWEGPTDFEPEHLRFQYNTDGSVLPAWLLALLGDGNVLLGGAFVLGVVVVGAYALTRDDGRERLPVIGADGGTDVDGRSTGGEATPTGTDAGAATADAGAATVAADEGSADGPAPAADEEPDDVDLDLLSDEERVERLLAENGGRMKQANIVRETGWSNAKVSQLLSSMDDEGRIDKLRIGRENLISFPDEEITDVDK